MVHEVLTWFNQPYLCPRMRENDFTIQQRILQRTKPDTTIGFPKHPMFPHSLYHTLLRALLLHRVSPVLPHISIHLVQSLQVHLHLIIFPLMNQNIYRDISNNLPYSMRKSNIIIIYQPRNILYNIIYTKGIYTNQEFGTLPNNLLLGPNSMKLIFNLSMTQTFLYHITMKEQSASPSVKIPFVFILCAL